jgi:hypothetical protein
MGTDYNNIRESLCPDCGMPMTLMTHRFRPPKKADDQKWETVKFLVENGFPYQHVYEEVTQKDNEKAAKKYADYPENLREAREFVKKHKEQALKKKQ